MTTRTFLRAAVLVVCAGCVMLFVVSSFHKTTNAPEPAPPHREVIPPGIVVTESSISVPYPPTSVATAPGDQLLIHYATPAAPPQQDLVIMARTVANFLLLCKQASALPLSANEEWSAAMRGRRPGIERWISDDSPALDANKRLIDRWGTPLHFHALGGKQWEIRSAGPDQKLWSDDDLLEKTSG